MANSVDDEQLKMVVEQNDRQTTRSEKELNTSQTILVLGIKKLRKIYSSRVAFYPR